MRYWTQKATPTRALRRAQVGSRAVLDPAHACTQRERKLGDPVLDSERLAHESVP
jgi:hypothetical protein